MRCRGALLSRGRYVRVAAGTLGGGGAGSSLCVSAGWHFEGLAGWVCVMFGLFAGSWVVPGVVAAAMCEWRLAHWGIGVMVVVWVFGESLCLLAFRVLAVAPCPLVVVMCE